MDAMGDSVERRHERDKPNGERFIDGCHRYNWILGPIITILLYILMASFDIGGEHQMLRDVKAQLTVLEQRFNAFMDGKAGQRHE